MFLDNKIPARPRCTLQAFFSDKQIFLELIAIAYSLHKVQNQLGLLACRLNGTSMSSMGDN